MPRTRLASKLLKWYSAHARDLPWRKHNSPYRTWVSEVMLQQTRVEVVIPYYRRWMHRFPSMRKLAAASERDVLSLWEGLGYYSRALNMRRAAQAVMKKHGGRLPRDPSTLRELPGVGDYIAAAITSIAFGRDLPALDGNVRRVLARVACIRASLDSRQGTASMGAVARGHLPGGRAGDFNQALMDLGAMICVPRRPRCAICPLVRDCEAHRRGLEHEIPRRSKSHAIPHYVTRAAVVVRGSRVLLVRRAGGGLLGGLWEFPKANRASRLPTHNRMAEDLKKGALPSVRLEASPGKLLGRFEQTYSHFSITVHAFMHDASASTHRRGPLWVPLHRLSSYPMGKVDRQIAMRLQQGVRAGKWIPTRPGRAAQ